MKKVRKAIFPVAGMGTRFLPATKASPKEMLPLVDKPLIQYVVEEAIDSGIQEIILITGRGKNSIESHFDRSLELENLLEKRNQSDEVNRLRKISDMCDFWYIRQKEPLGLGHAVLMVRNMVGDEPFAVLLGDDIIYSEGKPVLKQLLEQYEKTGKSIIGIEEVSRNKTSSYGIIEPNDSDGQLYKINSLVEKPRPENAPSNLAVIGRYVLTPAIFKMLENVQSDHKGEIQLTAGLNMLCQVEEMYGYRFMGKRYDAGDKLGFLIATVEFALRRDDLGAAFRQYLASLNI